MVDPSIIESVKTGEQRAFQSLYNACIRYVYAIVRRYVSNESDHEDVIQEVFARLFTSIGTFDPEKGPFKIWLRRIVINQCMKVYRQRKSPRLYVPLEVAEEPEVETENAMAQLSVQEINQLLSGMPEGYQQVFMLVEIEDYSHLEVGEMLDITPETSRSQLSRAKRWLRKNINKQKFFLGDGVQVR